MRECGSQVGQEAAGAASDVGGRGCAGAEAVLARAYSSRHSAAELHLTICGLATLL